MVSFTQVVGLICEEVACNPIATMADLAAADLEEIQQGTSEATREERLQGRIARIAEAQTQLEHDRKALAQAESDAAVARSESDLKEAEDQIAKEQAAIKARFAVHVVSFTHLAQIMLARRRSAQYSGSSSQFTAQRKVAHADRRNRRLSSRAKRRNRRLSSRAKPALVLNNREPDEILGKARTRSRATTHRGKNEHGLHLVKQPRCPQGGIFNSPRTVYRY